MLDAHADAAAEHEQIHRNDVGMPVGRVDSPAVVQGNAAQLLVGRSTGEPQATPSGTGLALRQKEPEALDLVFRDAVTAHVAGDDALDGVSPSFKFAGVLAGVGAPVDDAGKVAPLSHDCLQLFVDSTACPMLDGRRKLADPLSGCHKE